MTKRIFFIAFAGFIVLFTSCSKDKEKTARKAIIGKWNIDKVIYNDTVAEDAGTFKFTKKDFQLEDYTYVVNNNQVQEVTYTDDKGAEEVLGYDFFEGSTDMVFTLYAKDGRPNGLFIELMTKKVLIFKDGGTPSTKYYLSK